MGFMQKKFFLIFLLKRWNYLQLGDLTFPTKNEFSRPLPPFQGGGVVEGGKLAGKLQ